MQSASLLAHVPIYEYRCPNGHTFELFQKMSDAPAEMCVTCGEGPVEKLLFPVAVHFKGSGFYSTDYGSRKGNAEGQRDVLLQRNVLQRQARREVDDRLQAETSLRLQAYAA